MKMTLNGNWKVTWVPYRENIAHMLEPAFVPEGWLTAQIPEDIHATLRRAGLVRGHFYGKDPAEDSWIEEKDWVYYRSFCPDEDGPESGQERGPLIMDFEGLDTFSEVYLNGECVAGGDNMFVPVTADVSGKVRFGQRNVLLVRIRSAVKETEGTDYSALFSHMAFDRIPVRKAQMNYGWDFCERSVTAGIWKEVSLYDRPACCIQDYYLYTASLTQEEAVLYLQATAAFRDREGPGQENEEAKYSFTAELGGEGGCKARAEGSLETFRNGIRLPVSSPELWWPRPYGKPYLYDFTLTLYRGDRPEDCRKQKFGIRTVRLLQERTAEGRSFRFIVNGRQLFIRGSNWVPLDVVYTDIPDDRYDAMIRYAVQGRLSMLRIWGGGIYENERLFRLCDENGIMIWNDFMFACGIYPQDECFLRNVAGEASWAIRKYRNFTCLVLWAGSNEDDQAYQWGGRAAEFPKDRIGRGVLADACRELDPDRPYLPSTPYSPDYGCFGGEDPNAEQQGDMHIYIFSGDPKDADDPVRDHRYYRNILRYRPRFVSEFGFISLPEIDSYRQYNFLKKPLANRELIRRCVPFFDEIAGDDRKAVYYTQLYNALALKYWIEYFRSLKGICGGTLYWKFDDPLADTEHKEGLFPTMMSVIDMYGRPKMTFYYTMRAYADVLVTARETQEGWDIYGISELTADREGTLEITRFDLGGQALYRRKKAVVIGADRSTLLCRMNRSELQEADPLGQYLRLRFLDKDHVCIAENRCYFADIRDLQALKLRPARIEVCAHRSGQELIVSLLCDRFAPDVRLFIPDTEAVYEDNYFALDAGETKTVRVGIRESGDLRDRVLCVEAVNAEPAVVPFGNMQET